MPASKAQQRAVTKYMKAKYDEIKVRVEKGQKDTIQAHAEARSESVNGFIGRAISETMERDSGRAAASGAVRQGAGTAPVGRVVYQVPAADTAGRPQKAAETPVGVGAVSLPSETLEAAQRASEAVGEELPDFVRRAVDTQVERDKVSLRSGINPATGGKLDKEA